MAVEGKDRDSLFGSPSLCFEDLLARSGFQMVWLRPLEIYLFVPVRQLFFPFFLLCRYLRCRWRYPRVPTHLKSVRSLKLMLCFVARLVVQHTFHLLLLYFQESARSRSAARK